MQIELLANFQFQVHAYGNVHAPAVVLMCMNTATENHQILQCTNPIYTTAWLAESTGGFSST